jgi:F0F1-type ATP synthase epsilon subunit
MDSFKVSDKTDQQTNKKEHSKSLKVRISSPYQIYFDEPALSISGENLTGPFDILPGHHNFITLLTACELSIKTDNGMRKIKINGGVMHVKTDMVTVFLDI